MKNYMNRFGMLLAMLSAIIVASCGDDKMEGPGDNAPKSSTCDLLSLRINRQSGLKDNIVFKLDAASRELTATHLTWINKADPEKLVATFTTNGTQVIVDGAEVISGKTEISFADDFTMTVVAENGDEKDYTVRLNCPQINRELPVLHVRPDVLITGKQTYIPTYVELYDKTPSSTGKGWWDSAEKGKIEMRGRGNSTWQLPKKPFRLKFSEKFSPIGLEHAKDKSWVIMGQDMDKSLIRNYIAFEYSRILFDKTEGYHDEKTLCFTPCIRLINVYYTGDYYYSDTKKTRYLDGEYLGVYQLSDQMNVKKGRIDVDELTAADGSNPDKITGGYVIETDIHEGNRYSKRGLKMTFKYPDEDDFDQTQYDYITNFINQAEDALYSSNYTDPISGWRRYLDEKSLADFIIVKELAQDMDGYTSTYMYKRRGIDKLFFGPVWDCDKGWDNEVRVPDYSRQPLTSLMIHAGFGMPGMNGTDWFERLWTDATFRTFVARRWAEKREELLAATERILDEVPLQASKSIAANFSVWDFYYQYNSEAKMPAATYDEEIARIRRLTRNRAALLDRLFNE